MAKPKPRKIGGDARNGPFIPVEVAQRRKSTAVVETLSPPKRKRRGK